MTAVTIENARLTKDEAALAVGIGTSLAADLAKAVKSAEGIMQSMYSPIVKAVNGRQANMVKAIIRACKIAIEASGGAVGTVAQVCTVVQYHADKGLDFPKSYKDAREAYEERPKAKREPRTPSATTVQSEPATGESESLTAVATPSGLTATENQTQLRELVQLWAILTPENRANVLERARNLRAEQALEAEIARDAAESAEMGDDEALAA